MSNVSDLRPLTTLQFDECKDRARKRVERNIGDKPTRKQFVHELGSLWTALDAIALVVFVMALIVSSVHIITHMGKLAAESYSANQAGTIITENAYVGIHQWAMIPLAEGSMILFMVMFGLTRAGWRRWVYLVLAGGALLFVAVANWQSGIGTLEALLAPVFTIGIGLKLEHLLVQSIKRKAEVDAAYLQALKVYEAATADSTKHPDYQGYLYNEIWQALMKPKGNQWAIEAPAGFKVAAVRRELERDSWVSAPAVVTEFKAETQPTEVLEPERVALPFGNIPHETADPESMPVTMSVNGHGTTVTNQN